MRPISHGIFTGAILCVLRLEIPTLIQRFFLIHGDTFGNAHSGQVRQLKRGVAVYNFIVSGKLI